MKKKLIAVVMCGILAVSFAGCSLFDKGGSSSGGQEATDTQGAETAKGSTVLFADETLQVMLPDGFTQLDAGTLNDEADIEMANEKKLRYGMCLMEPKEDFDLDYSGYVALVTEGLASVYGSSSMGEVQSKTVDGKTMDFVVLEMTESGIKSYFNVYFVETEHYYGQVFVWSMKSGADWVDENGGKIAASVQETSNVA